MFSGKVTLEILSASNLPDSDGSLNSFLKVKVDSTDVFQTETVKYTFNPVWNEYREFDQKNGKHIIFCIQRDDREKKIVAQCKLSLHELLLKQIGKSSVKLVQPLSPQGELEVEISLRESDKIKEKGEQSSSCSRT